VSEIVDIAEESSKFPDEWVLFELTQVTEEDLPVRGRLLFHGRSREDLHRAATEARGLDTYAFFTGEPVPANVIPVP
jgi:hypothetical protein